MNRVQRCLIIQTAKNGADGSSNVLARVSDTVDELGYVSTRSTEPNIPSRILLTSGAFAKIS